MCQCGLRFLGGLRGGHCSGGPSASGIVVWVSTEGLGAIKRHGYFSRQEGSAQGHGVRSPRGWQPESCDGNMASPVSIPREPGLWGRMSEQPQHRVKFRS